MTDIPYQPTDRPSLAARLSRWANALARELARRGVSAKAISLGGLGAGMAAGAAFARTASLDGLEQRLAWLAGTLGVQLRLLANLLDGMVAIASSQASRLSELYNDVPDRLSDVAAMVGLGSAVCGQPELGYLTTGAVPGTAYLRVLGKTSGLPAGDRGPLAKQHRMFVVTLGTPDCGLAPAVWQPSFSLASRTLVLVGGGVLWTAARRLHAIAWQ